MREGGGQLASSFSQSVGSHLVFQLILSVYLVLSNIEVVGGVVVDGLCRKPVTHTRYFANWVSGGQVEARTSTHSSLNK